MFSSLFLTLTSEAAKVFRPYVAFTAYGAGVKNMLCAFETKSKYNNAFPIFNEEFTFQTTGDWKKIDIQISVKVSFRPLISILDFFNTLELFYYWRESNGGNFHGLPWKV